MMPRREKSPLTPVVWAVVYVTVGLIAAWDFIVRRS